MSASDDQDRALECRDRCRSITDITFAADDNPINADSYKSWQLRVTRRAEAEFFTTGPGSSRSSEADLSSKISNLKGLKSEAEGLRLTLLLLVLGIHSQHV